MSLSGGNTSSFTDRLTCSSGLRTNGSGGFSDLLYSPSARRRSSMEGEETATGSCNVQGNTHRKKCMQTQALTGTAHIRTVPAPFVFRGGTTLEVVPPRTRTSRQTVQTQTWAVPVVARVRMRLFLWLWASRSQLFPASSTVCVSVACMSVSMSRISAHGRLELTDQKRGWLLTWRSH